MNCPTSTKPGHPHCWHPVGRHVASHGPFAPAEPGRVFRCCYCALHEDAHGQAVPLDDISFEPGMEPTPAMLRQLMGVAGTVDRVG